VHQVQHAIRLFIEHFEEFGFGSLAIGVACHLTKTLCTSRAWRNVIAAAYPGQRVPWRSIYAAYLAGVGVNAILPARSGDVLRLYLTRRAVPAATYTTLTATYAVMSIFDSAMALSVFAYALSLGVLPGLHVLPHLPEWDFGWFLRNPRFTETLGVALAIAGVVIFLWARRHVRAFRARVGQAFTIVRTPRLYLRRVALWQACDWALRFATVWFFLRAFGVPDTVRNVLLVLATSSLATLAPVTPGGIGTEQAFLVYVFGGAVTKTRLLAFSVGMKVTLTVINVVLGFAAIFLVLRTFRYRKLVDHPEPTHADSG
jgi:glycosyltransferase 2 family protein